MNETGRTIPVSGANIAFEVRAIRETETRKSVVLVEGFADSLLYRRFFIDGSAYRLINCHGKDNLVAAMTALGRSPVPGVLAVCDADYDPILGATHPAAVLLTDQHDSEVMSWVHGFAETCIDEILFQNGQLGRHNAREISDLAVDYSTPLGLLRLQNQASHWELTFRGLEAGRFVKKRRFDSEAYVQALLEVSPRSTVDSATLIRTMSAAHAHDPNDLINGHDLASVVNAILAHRLRKKRRGGAGFESMLRLAFHGDRFRMTRLIEAMRAWEDSTGYEILADELAS